MPFTLSIRSSCLWIDLLQRLFQIMLSVVIHAALPKIALIMCKNYPSCQVCSSGILKPMLAKMPISAAGAIAHGEIEIRIVSTLNFYLQPKHHKYLYKNIIIIFFVFDVQNVQLVQKTCYYSWLFFSDLTHIFLLKQFEVPWYDFCRTRV